ncbi:MAG: hypothetical protein MZV49_00610 [Rhodopseudomonas palustris]|nr:hypothetical protein [Rhodopseudomonas palustris]
MQLDQLKQVVEVLIFASDIPLPVDQIRATVEETTVEDVVRAVDELNVEYRRTGPHASRSSTSPAATRW